MFGESRFSRSGCCGSFWQRGCGNFFAWFTGRTASQCTPCDHSCWNVTNQKCNKPCGFRTNRTCDRTLIGPLSGECTGHRWIPLTRACDAALWCFLWFAPEHTVEWFGWWFETPSCPLWSHCNEMVQCSYTLSREYRVVRYRYSRLLFTSEDRLFANLRVHEQSTNMTSQWQCPTFAWRHRSTLVTSQY